MRFEASAGDRIYLATFTSTSDDLAVAKGFAGGDGVILQFRGLPFKGRVKEEIASHAHLLYDRNDAADVSWM